MSKARILLADDHALVRRGVRMILEATGVMEVRIEVGDGHQAVEALRDNHVDLAILDVAMPRMTGLAAAREISRMRTAPPILMLSMHDNEQYFFSSLQVGASGYVLKSLADRDLVEAAHAALRGESYLYPGVERTLVRDWLARVKRGERMPERLLTAREDEVVKLIAESHSSREIAQLLSISVKTVERHRENILSKLGMRDRTELTRYAVRAGLVEP